MTWLGEMFESADMCGGKCPLVLMGGRAEGLACADPGIRTPIGDTRNSIIMIMPYFDKNCCSLFSDVGKYKVCFICEKGCLF
jgi:hypothetical protein